MINKNTLVYLLSGLIALVIVTNLFFGSTNVKILETSVLSILQNLAEKNAPMPPDLSIDNVVLRKVASPSKKFNFYKYNATVVVSNFGGNLKNGRVVLNSGREQKHTLVKNTDQGFSLKGGEKYIIRNYEIIFDGNYNGGEIDVKIDLVDLADSKKENNSYKLSIFESEPKISDIKVKEIAPDGNVVIDFNAVPFSSGDHEFYLMTADSLSFDPKDARYAEIENAKDTYGYTRIRNSIANVSSGFEENQIEENEAREISFSDDPLNFNEEFYVYLKAVDSKNGNYAISNVLRFGPQTPLTKAQALNFFIEYADIKPAVSGEVPYEDVKLEDWYYFHVLTFHNLGLLDLDAVNFYPDRLMTRAQAVMTVVKYFDGDLGVSKSDPHFSDVDETHYLYPYVEGLLTSGKGMSFGEKFHPEGKVSKDFLKYLINEYRENN